MTAVRPVCISIVATTVLIAVGSGCQSAGSAAQPAYPAAHALPQTVYPAPAGRLVATVIQRTLVYPLPPDTAPEPPSGKAAISGLLFSVATLSPIADTMFYLTPAVGEEHDHMPPFLSGPNPERGDVSGYSREDGSFQADSLPPGNFFLIVSAPGNWCEAIESDTDPLPRRIVLAAGQRMVLGLVSVRWP